MSELARFDGREQERADDDQDRHQRESARALSTAMSEMPRPKRLAEQAAPQLARAFGKKHASGGLDSSSASIPDNPDRHEHHRQVKLSPLVAWALSIELKPAVRGVTTQRDSSESGLASSFRGAGWPLDDHEPQRAASSRTPVVARAVFECSESRFARPSATLATRSGPFPSSTPNPSRRG